jgi:hypothetical protein
VAASFAGFLLLAAVAGDLFSASLAWQRAAVGEPIASVDHRPRPLVIHVPEAAVARLSRFGPNQLAYQVAALRPTRVVLPLRFGARQAEWEAHPFAPSSHAGKVAIEVPAGEHEVSLRYRPPWLREGLGVSAATCALLLVLGLHRRRGLRAAR